MDNLTKYVSTRLIKIQNKYNFNPNLGISQITESKLREAYGAFKELLDLIKYYSLDVKLFYDPAGQSKIEIVVPKEKIQQVYFAYDSSVWKIGLSSNVYKHQQCIQTYNPKVLFIPFTIDGDLKLKNIIKRYLKNYKTRHPHKRKGEWFDVSYHTMKEIYSKLIIEGPLFLTKSYLPKLKK